MKFKTYTCVFIGIINNTRLIYEKLNREIPEFFKISRITSRTKIEPGSRDLGN